MKTLIIINPISSKIKKYFKNHDKIIELLKTKYDVVDEIKTKYRFHAGEIIRTNKGKYDLIIFAGGDGLINESLEAIIETKQIFSFIALGGANVLSIEIGFSKNPIKTVKKILSGTKNKIYLGKVDNTYFILMFEIGLGGYSVKYFNPKIKKINYYLAYLFSATKSFLSYRKYSTMDVEVKNDNIVKNINNIKQNIITNVKHYAGNYTITKNTSLQKQKLIMIYPKKNSLFSFLKGIISIFVLKKSSSKNLLQVEADEIKIKLKDNSFSQIDGDYFSDKTEYTVKVITQPVEMIY